jgi:uncharacterized protein YaaN involved in tellurite resistance
MPPRPLVIGGSTAPTSFADSTAVVISPATVSTPPALRKPFSLEEIGAQGGVAQKSIANVTDKITGIARTSDMDEVGKMLGTLLVTAKGYNPGQGGGFSLTGLFKTKAQQIRNRFDSVDSSVQQLMKDIDKRIALFRQRVIDLGTIGEANKQYRSDLEKTRTDMLARCDWMDANVPPESQDVEEAQKRATWLQVAAYARKRADDLHRVTILAEQQSAQIELMKFNSSALAMKFSDIAAVTIPALKNNFTLYVLNLEAKKGVEFADEIDALTNSAIQQNAKQLGANTTAIHTSLNRSTISMETLQMNAEAIVNAIAEVERINKETRDRLASEAPKLKNMTRDLAQRLSK